MIAELRRRAYLSAMQVASWLPRVELPFAAPSRPELLQPLVEAEPEQEVAAAVPQAAAEAAPAYEPPRAETAVVAPVTRPKIEVPRPAPQGRMAKVEPATVDAETQITSQPTPVAPPRFALQLLRAGACAVLVELPTGEPLQGRDPAYLLLKDLLRAAGLPVLAITGRPAGWSTYEYWC